MKNLIILISIFLFALSSSAKEKVTTAFIDKLEYRGVVLDRQGYYTWGSSVVKGDDGKFHLYACQWSTEHGFGKWSKESEVNYYVGDSAEGPFRLVNNVVPSRPSSDPKAWNRYTAHNPEVKIIDGKYVLTYISYEQGQIGKKGRIGMKISDKPEGPWRESGNGMILQESKDPSYPSYNSRRGTDNPSLIKFEGKYYLFFMYNPGKGGDNTSLGVAIADKLEGPYLEQKTPALKVPKGKKVEDLCVFVEGKSISAVMCDNFGMYALNGGIYTQFDARLFKQNGTVKMKVDSIAWKTRPKMFPTLDFSKGRSVYGGNKYERPKILKVNGVPAYMYLPSGYNARGDKWTVLHLFKIHPNKSPRGISEKLLPGTLPVTLNLGKNFAASNSGAQATASSVWKNQSAHSAKAAIDGQANTRWASEALKADFEISLMQPREINCVRIREFNKRIKTYTLEAFVDGAWKSIHQGNGIDDKTLEFDAVKTARVRLRILKATEPASLWEMEIYLKSSK